MCETRIGSARQAALVAYVVNIIPRRDTDSCQDTRMISTIHMLTTYVILSSLLIYSKTMSQET